MEFTWLSRWQPQLLAILRIVAGLLFLEHGTSKFFDFPVAFPMPGPLPPMLMVAGIIEIAAGMLIWAARHRGSVGLLATLLGVLWLAPDWVGWEAGPAFVRSVAMLVAPLLPAVLVHLVLVFPAGRIPPGGARAAVAVRT